MIKNRGKLINIDHHATNTLYGDINIVDTSACATAEVAYKLFLRLGCEITQEIATLLLLGICFDTSVFSNQATNHRCFSYAAELTRHGGNLQQVTACLRNSKAISVLRVWGRALERLRTHKATGAAVTYITLEDIIEFNAQDEDIGGISDFLNLTSLARTLIVLHEKDNGVKVSMRTQGGDVSQLASTCGGGGHKKAAGFFVPNCKVENLLPPKNIAMNIGLDKPPILR